MGQDHGFIFIVVLWLIAIVAVAAATFRNSTQTSIQLASNLSENARAEAYADAGAELAFADILESAADPQRPPRFPPDGRSIRCSIDSQVDVIISVRDASGLVDLNTAGLPLLEALLAGVGARSNAKQLAAAIYDFKDNDDDARSGGSEREAYANSGLDTPPKNAPFSSVHELNQVLGFEAALVEKLQPYVTVLSGQPGIDPNSADAQLLDILQRGIRGHVFSLNTFAISDQQSSLPAIFISPPLRRVFMVRSDALTTNGSRFIRDAELDTVSRRTLSRKIVGWHRMRNAAPHRTAASRAPQC